MKTRRTFATAVRGSAIANYRLAQRHYSVGPVNFKFEVLNLTVEALAGPGLGVFVDAVVADSHSSVLGNLFGVRNGCNANTGGNQ